MSNLEKDWTKILGWPGYRVYHYEINEKAKKLKLWVRRKSGNQKLVCGGCGQRVHDIREIYEREVRDLPWGEYQVTVVIELYRVNCGKCGVKTEKVDWLPSKAPFSKRFEDGVGQACESAPVRRVAHQFQLPERTVRAIDVRYLERWAARRRQPALRQMGVDEIYLGKSQKFLTVVSNLQTGEPLWFGWERKQETLDQFFQQELSARQRHGIEAACVDMHEPFRLSIEAWAPQCSIVYDKFHIMGHANEAVAEVRRAEFFRQGGEMREVMKGKHWLLLTRWVNLSANQKGMLTQLLGLNRRLMKAYLLKESLDRLWNYVYPGAMMNYLLRWMDQLRWQRLRPLEKLADMLIKHLPGILNYCKHKVPLGVVEAINGNIKALLRRGRGYRDMNYLLLKAQRLAFTKTEFITFQKAA
jgi:transposase